MKETSSLTNRAVLLESALQLFAQRGYDAVGVREVVEQVRLIKPTLYYYFSSKQGLLTALLEQRFDPISTLRANTYFFTFLNRLNDLV